MMDRKIEMGEEKESPTTIFPFANVMPAWSQPQPNSELCSRLAAARSFALPQICPTENAAGLLC
jgi:hypothetical protein